MSEKKLVIKFKYGTSASGERCSRTSPPPAQYEWNYKRIALAIGIAVLVLTLLTLHFWAGAPDQGKPGGSVDSERSETSDQALNRPIPPDSGSLTEPSGRTGELGVARSRSAGAKPAESPSNRNTATADRADSGQIHSVDHPSEQQPVGGSGAADQAGTDQRGPALAKPIVRAQFTWGIKNREPTGQIRSPAILQPGRSVDLYLFSDIIEMNGQTISHVWSHNGRVVLTKDFQIRGDRWRIFSRKELSRGALGQWKVTIRNREGANLGEFVLDVLAPGNQSN